MTDEELVVKIRDLLVAAEWEPIVPRLMAFTRNYLVSVYGAEAQHWEKAAHAYVERAVGELVDRAPQYARWQKWGTLFQLLCIIIKHLVLDDDRKLKAIVEGTDWSQLVARLIAQTVKDLGGTLNRLGKSPEDYVQEAVALLLQRRRHFPHYRPGVTLFRFLRWTVHSLRTHDVEKLKSQGLHFTIVSESAGDRAGWREIAEELLPGAEPEISSSAQLDPFLRSLEEHLQMYLRLRIAGGCRTASECAAALGVSERTIRNWDRQIARRAKAWKTQV